MKNKKVIDIDKFMDRVFLHNKNADERLWDFILRSATFFILLIIIMMSGLKVCASNSGNRTISDIYDIDFSLLPVSTENSLLWRSDEYTSLLAQYTDITYNSNYHPPYQVTGYTTNMEVPSQLYMDNCYNWYCWAGAGMEGFYVYSIPKHIIDDGICIWTRNGFYATEDFTYYTGSQWYGNQTYPLGAQTFDSSTVHQLSNDQYCSTANAYFSNCPMWTGDLTDPLYTGLDIDYDDIISRIQSSDFEESYELFNCNYFLYGDIMIQPWEERPEKESNNNHLYFKDVQVGITCTSANQDIVSSQVVVGVSVDDWVLNHINDYYVFCQYTFHMKDSYTGSADPNFTVTKVVPLNAFMNDGYCYSVYDLWQEGNFINYYNMINSTYKVKVRSKYETFNKGLMPTLINWVTYGFADYYLDSIDHIENAYEVFDFGLDVNVILSNGALGGNGNISKPYTKEFDFLRGTASVTNAEGLRNHNPWTGESDPQANPIIPNSGGSSNGNGNGDGATAIAYGGNVNVTINNGLGGNSDDITDTSPTNSIREYLDALNEMKSSINEFTVVEEDAQGNKTFLAFMKDTLDGFPIMEEMVNVIKIIIGVCLIVIVIKLLLALV